MAASRISVEVAGQSGSLQAAVAKAADSLKGLGDVLSRQTDLAIGAGEKTIRLNELVAKSYGQAAAQAGLASDRTIAAFERQGAVALRSSREQMRAAEGSAAAAKAASDQQIRSAESSAAASERSATRHVASAKKVEQAFGSSSSALTRTGKTMALGLLGAAAASVDLGAKFQSNTLRMQTQAGATAAQLQKIRQGLLGMAQAVGYTPNQLADGMYHVVSSMTAAQRATYGVTGELNVMATAAKLARVGHAGLEDTTYALVSALQALHEPLSNVGKLAGQVNAIVGSGDMTMTDFVEALKSGLLPAAQTAGISLQSLGGAMAAMGDQGMRGSLAGTRLRMSIALLSSPSAAAAKVLQTLGLTAKEATSSSSAMAAALEKAGLRTTSLSADLRRPDGIAYALTDLRDHLEKAGLTATGAAAVMNKAFGGGRMGATITLLENNLGRVSSKFDQIGSSAGQFGSDWQRTSHTTAFELRSLEGGVSSLATSIGTDLLPAANRTIHDISDVVHWFEQGSAAAHALEIGIGTLATVAIGSYLVSNLRKAITLMREFGQLAVHPVSSAGGFLRSTAPGSPGGAAGIARAATGGIVGARGAELPGSIANPIIVAIEAGQYAGLSSMGAAGTVATEQKVAMAETGAAQSVSKGGVVLPSGVAGAEAGAAARGASVAEAAAGTSMLSTLRTGVSSVLGNAMKGAGIAGIGVLGAQAAGSIVGGKPGKAISDIGSLTALGAGIGTAIEPGIGTALGGVAGALAGTLKDFLHHTSFGQHEANQLSTPGHANYSAATKADIAKQIDLMAGIVHPGTQVTHAGVGRFGVPVRQEITLDVKSLTVDQLAKYMGAAKRAGHDLAGQLEKGWGQYKFQSEPIMFTQLRSTLAGMPPAVQAFAVKSVVAYAEGLVKAGKLPVGAAQQMLQQIEAQFPAFERYLGLAGNASIQQFNRALDFSHAEDSVKRLLGSFRTQFPQVTAAMDSAGADIGSQSAAVGQALESIIHGPHSTAAMVKAATQDLRQLQQQTHTSFTQMAGLVGSQMTDMAASVKAGSASSAQTANTNFTKFSQAVAGAMAAGTLATSQGMQLIAQVTDQMIVALGGTRIPIPQLIRQQRLTSMFSAGTITSASLLTKAAGGFVGSPGEAGRDTVHALLGRGEAVLKHQDQAIVNSALAGTRYGSLDGVFAATQGQKHWMAQGGYAGYSLPLPRSQMLPGSWSIDQGVDIPAPAGTPEFAIGPGVITGEGISGFGPNAPILKITSGPLAGATIYYGHAGADLVKVGQSVRAGEQISEVGSGIVGISTGPHIEIGYYPPGGAGAGSRMALTLNQLLGGAGVTGLAGAGGALGQIAAPGVTGVGAVAGIVRGALKLAAATANRYLGAAGGAGAAGVSGSLAGAGRLVPGIMAIERQAAAIAGLAFDPAIAGALLGHESSGGVNEPPSGPLSATGPNQVTPGTFRQYALAGHTNIGNPLDNAIASWRYVKAAYGSMAQMAAATGLLGPNYKGYAGGGLVYAASGLRGTHFTSSVAGASKSKAPPKPGRAPKGVAAGMSVKDLRELSQVGGHVNSIETTIARLAGTYQADSTMFSPQEAEAQYLNADGSLNAAGYAKKIADDQTLLGIDQQLLGLYNKEVPAVSHALTKWLGEQSTTQSTLSADKQTIAANRIKEAAVRRAILDLRKPVPDQVGALEGSIAAARHRYDPLVKKAEDAEGRYHGKDKATRSRLRDAVIGARDTERNAIDPLQGALDNARRAQKARKFHVSSAVWHLQRDLARMTGEDTRLQGKDSRLQAILSGSGGAGADGTGVGINPAVALLEAVAGKLGMVNWKSGRFAGIDTTMPGEIVSVSADIQTLKNDLGQAQADQSGAASSLTDNSQLVTLLEQQNLQLSEALALNEAQTSVLAGMLPEIPHFDKGGPVLDDGLVMAHRDEYVVPRGGALVSGGGTSGPSTVELHQHFHGQAGALMSLIDQRIQHPDNVRAVSRIIGNRTSMLRGSPGSR